MSDKHAMANWPLRRYDFPMPIRYHLSPPRGNGVVVCLHGFQDHALSMVRRLGWWETDLPFQVLAVNGPFPVPVWRDNGFIEAYSWYFRDTEGDLDFVSPNATADRLDEFLHDLGLRNTPKVLFGFSMGGYLSPYVAAQTPNVKGIVGYGTGYIPDIYAKCKPMTVHAIHGDQDERIKPTQAQEDFKKILQLGHHGQFHLLPGVPHRVEHSAEPLVRKLVLECLKSP